MAKFQTEPVEISLVRLSLSSAPKLQTGEYRATGKYPIIDQGQGFIAGWTDDERGLIATCLPVIVFGDHTRVFKYVDFPFVRGADGTQILKPREGIDTLFFYYACRAIDLPGRGYNRHFTILKEKTIPLPDHREQRKIGKTLRQVEDAIEFQTKQLIITERLKRAAMRELFTRGLRGEPQKEIEIGLVPESWDVVCLGEQASAISKGASPKWQGFEYVQEGILFVRSQNVGDGFMIWGDKVFLPAAWNEKEKRSILQAGDVLINLVGASIGRSAVGGEEIDSANCNQAVCFVRLIRDRVLPKFLNGFLLTSEGQKQIHGSKKDVARANLSLEDVRQIQIAKPSLDEQREIVEILDAIDQKIDLHNRKRAVLEELFKTLLHKLMTGEIRVADLDLSALKSAEKAEAAE